MSHARSAAADAAPADHVAAPRLDFAALAATPVVDEPFPHLIVPDFLPPDVLARVQADLPRKVKGGSFPPGALDLGPAARAVMDDLEGPELKARIAAKFGIDLADAPTMLTVRLATRAKDGQIHTDSRTKRVTALLYLNPEGPPFENAAGRLRLLRNDHDLEDFVAEIPPTRGTLLVFLNGPNAWHGHHPHVGPRYAVQLNYMVNDSLARSELRRHKISAWVKRVTAAF